ncbi:MAG TPA: type II CAAX endopeptidase family protein [Candidatus Dormibacteraeota bacterium]|nr:type II CAAX endopeptidase family protein [Candidatus Dormibacteraeota bacterium]
MRKRVLAFPLVRLLLIVAFFAVFAAPVVLGAHGSRDIRVAVVLNWVLAGLLAGTMIAVERVTVGKSLAAIGLGRRNASRDLALGAVLGAGLFTIVVMELALSGFYRVTAVHVTRDLALAALLLLPSAAIEELLFRGVLFRLVEEWLGTWIALAVSAAIFGAAHAANPGATWVSSLAIALEAGVLLGAAFVVTRNLWFPIGLHFAWNFFEGPVYGTQVSGRSFLESAVDARVTGPSLFTGGSFGPEAGLFAIVTCVIVAVALLAAASRRSLIVSRTSIKAS